jgi:hypothetical protein
MLLRVLFICSQNRLRSPTAEQVFASWRGIEVASAGLNDDAESPVTPELLEWDVTAHQVTGLDFDQRWLGHFAQARDHPVAARVEHTAGRWVGRARDLTLEQDPGAAIPL